MTSNEVAEPPADAELTDEIYERADEAYDYALEHGNDAVGSAANVAFRAGVEAERARIVSALEYRANTYVYGRMAPNALRDAARALREGLL